MKTLSLCVAALLGAITLAGCEQAGGAPAVIVDLAAIAEATGEDVLIQQKSQAVREELSQQLQRVAADLDAQINAERERIGASPTAEEQQQLEMLAMQARQQLSDAQLQAQNQASQIEQTLVDEFRADVMPLAQELAVAKGAQIVVAKDVYLLWYEDSLDITDAVIAAWQERAESAEASGEMAELEAELVEVEEQLEEAQEELEELQEAAGEIQSEEAVATP